MPNSKEEGDKGVRWPHVAAIEIQVLISKGGTVITFSGRANSEYKPGWHARCWLYSLTKAELEEHLLPAPEGVDFAKLRDYGLHVHYTGDPLSKTWHSSPLCLAALAAITGLKAEPEVITNCLSSIVDLV